MTVETNVTSTDRLGVTILLVEDEAPVRLLVRRVLERHGYRVVEAETAAAALELWPQHRDIVELLLTDLTMPEGLNGSELALKLRADKPSLRVIFTSGYGMESLGKDFRLDKASTFLEKPYNPRKLTDAIRHCLEAE